MCNLASSPWLAINLIICENCARPLKLQTCSFSLRGRVEVELSKWRPSLITRGNMLRKTFDLYELGVMWRILLPLQLPQPPTNRLLRLMDRKWREPTRKMSTTAPSGELRWPQEIIWKNIHIQHRIYFILHFCLKYYREYLDLIEEQVSARGDPLSAWIRFANIRPFGELVTKHRSPVQ